MKFQIGQIVQLTKTVNDGRTGKVVGFVEPPNYKYFPNGSEVINAWSGLLHIDKETIII